MELSLRIIFLGTGGSTPSVHRNLPAIAVRRGEELVLFDCGEGTQRQMMFAKVGFCRKMRILISHMHGDHILGLPGLFQTMSLLGRRYPLEIFGPKGICEFVDAVTETVEYNLTFQIEKKEVGEGLVYEGKGYEALAVWADHSAQNLAYALAESKRPGRFFTEKAEKLGVPRGKLWSRLQRGGIVKLENGRVVKPNEVTGPPRPGRKIVYSGDTRPCDAVERLALNADLLIHDCTLDDELVEKALEQGHSTPSQAASIANRADVKRLILTHISPRYDDPKILLEQARKIFPNVHVAEDLMEIEVPYAD